jgi:S-adenosylmethionine decarboxylase
MGTHLLLEVYDVNFDLLNDLKSIEKVMESGIQRAKMTILNVFSHSFDPFGVTIIFALSESHVSCHSWPEKGCIAVDVYTCGPNDPNIIATEILSYFNSSNYSLRLLDR